MSTNIIQIPSKLEAYLNEEHKIIILENLIPFAHLLRENKLYFFPDYTDHGINHIEGVLNTIEHLIDDKTFEKLSSLDVCAIIIATVLHDIGMHTNLDMFKKMIIGEYDHIPDNRFTETTWKELWIQYLKDSQFWNLEKIENVVGKKDYTIKEPDLDNLTEEDRKYIGEFIRIHHPRLAYEIALYGYQGHDESIGFNFEKNEKLKNKRFMQLSGLIARSHGMNVRDTFKYLKNISGEKAWKKPVDIKVVFLMTLIRIADYLQIESDRTDELLIKLRPINSPYSKREHETHLAIDNVQLDNDDSELIYVEASPEDAMMYVKIDHLIQDIQKEFDLSWAIIGEVYGNKYKLKYRRIMSNLSEENLKGNYTFVPQEFGFKFNGRLTELLIAPLYGDDPSYGVRELVQNAVDACRTRLAIDKDYANSDTTHVTVSIDSKSKRFKIVDKGIGMTIEEIEKYFLTIGSSFNDSKDWQIIKKDYIDTRNIKRIYRTGRFGIGILAAFLLGSEITVKTRSIKGDKQGYSFSLSLNKQFIQINKDSHLDYGTTILIQCNENTINMFNNIISDDWYKWYIDTKPRVEYRRDEVALTPYHIDVYNGYKHLQSSFSEYGAIYWKPINYSCIHLKDFFKSSLYCNGFLITENSNKSVFSTINGLERYIPLRIPSLIFFDFYNCLPLNLQRNNIDNEAKYPFELELAQAMCKDYLCQLLSIDINSFLPLDLFFFNKSGFTITYSDSNERNTESFLCKEKCLQGKTLVRIYGIDSFSFNSWSFFFMNHPDFYIKFNKQIKSRIVNENDYFNYLILDGITSGRIKLNNCIIAVNLERINGNYESFHAYMTYRKKFLLKDEVFKNKYDNYEILETDATETGLEFAKALISHFNQIQLTKKPLFFMIYKNENKDIKSDLDKFFEDYADGEMIIPYDEDIRRKKFAKTYNECSKEIEYYRKNLR